MNVVSLWILIVFVGSGDLRHVEETLFQSEVDCYAAGIVAANNLGKHVHVKLHCVEALLFLPRNFDNK